MVDLQPFLTSYGYPLAALLLAGLVGWLIVQTNLWLSAHAAFLSASTKQKILDAEKAALNEGAAVVMAQIKAAGDNAKVTVNDPITRFSVQIALDHGAGILASNGADADQVAAKILARLPDSMVAPVAASQATITRETISAAKPA